MQPDPTSVIAEHAKAGLTVEELSAKIRDLEAENKTLRDICVDIGGVGGCLDNTGIRAVVEIERLRTERSAHLAQIARLNDIINQRMPQVQTAVPKAAKATSSVIKVIRELLATAGEWPTECIQDKESGYYRCPLCDDGEIEAELVHRVHAGLAGIQVYGFGDRVAAMEQLMLVVVWHLPSILAVVDAAERIKRIVDGDRTKGKEVQEAEDAIKSLLVAVQTVQDIEYRKP